MSVGKNNLLLNTIKEKIWLLPVCLFILFNFCLFIIFNLSCSNKTKAILYNEGIAFSEYEKEAFPEEEIITLNTEEILLKEKIISVLSNIQLPEKIKNNIRESLAESSAFSDKLTLILSKDKYLWVLVDRIHSLDADYAPDDLVDLISNNYDTFRVAVGQKLRKIAADSLEEMVIEARNNNLRFFIGSSYRSFSEQSNSYARHVARVGAEAADRVSALPGHSQHQLGLAIDFGYATYDFAQTAEYEWLMKNISRFGWSLSFPRNYEQVTGYNWEPWHFRYVGTEITEFIDNYFDGIQHHALLFLHHFHRQN